MARQSAASRRADEEAEAERYSMLFEAAHAAQVREYFETGGSDPDFKPDWAKIDAAVKRQLNNEYVQRQIGRALGDDE
jgi:hypothetical protein